MAFRLFSKVFPKDSIYLYYSEWVINHENVDYDERTMYFRNVKVKIYDWYEGVGFKYCHYKVERNE